VRGDVLFESDFAGTVRGFLDESVVADVEQVDGVAAAEGSISTVELTLLDSDDEPMGGAGPPTIVSNWTDDEQLASYQIQEGRAPEADGEVVIDRAATDNGGFALGDTVTLLSSEGREDFELVGISTFGSADSAAGAISVATTLTEAQTLANEPGKVDTISVRATEGTTPEELVANLEAADLGPDVSVVTGKEAADELSNDIKEGFSFFSTLLLVFAAIALFVGWFIISNTFSILVAQRTRELALLRALGATKRQVLTSVFLEAGVIGVFSALLGFVGGVLLAWGAFAGLSAIGVDLPTSGLVIEPLVAGRAIVVGLVITAIAAAAPAIRATRVPPMAALRDVAIDQSGRSRIRLLLGLLIGALGAFMITPAFAELPTSGDIPGVGLGLFAIIVAVLVLGPVFARPVAWLMGVWLPKVRGVVGSLARENAIRNPRRTASTASALIIGVTLVAFITIFASSASASVTASLTNGFKGQYIVQPVNQFSFTGVTPDAAKEIADLDGVADVAAVGVIDGQLTLPNGKEPTGIIGAGDPEAFTEVFTIDMAEGQLTDIDDTSMAVDRAVAAQDDIAIGDEVTIVSRSGRTATFTVAAISDEPNLLLPWTITRAAAESLSPELTDYQIGIKLDDGVDAASMRQPIEDVLEPYPNMKLQDRDQFEQGIIQQIQILLNVIYALLAVSIVIALIGIANTLSLSIHERTREL
ncbi:MAG: ABC transporter permease, partial [Acidimicrobiales bacterium]|nr:ABC transporter permease [Acidimicrobiales bacterium]